MTDEQHERVFSPNAARHRKEKIADRESAADKAAKVMAIREMERPLDLKELEDARNKALRIMITRFHEMKPQEVISAVNVLDGESASHKATNGPDLPSKEPTREEMLAQLQGRKNADEAE